MLPWAVAAIALVSLLALVAGQQFAASRGGPSTEPSGAVANAAPDISRMTPREMTVRLYGRIMQLYAGGRKDSAQFLAANMAIPAFEMLDALDADTRYELGRMAEVAGAPQVARAQADTILAAQPQHLLGLTLAAIAARMRGDDVAARRFDSSLVAAEASELKRALPEYAEHREDIDRAVADARRGG
jgi:hypothetical protein